MKSFFFFFFSLERLRTFEQGRLPDDITHEWPQRQSPKAYYVLGDLKRAMLKHGGCFVQALTFVHSFRKIHSLECWKHWWTIELNQLSTLRISSHGVIQSLVIPETFSEIWIWFTWQLQNAAKFWRTSVNQLRLTELSLLLLFQGKENIYCVPLTCSRCSWLS